MKAGIGIAIILILAINLTLGAMSVGYLCETVTGKRPHFAVSAVIGMFVAEITIPAAVVAWGLRSADIITAPLVKP